MKKVLFVDDEKDLHPIVASYFPKEHYRVICAADGSEGMQKCRNENFDLVIVDFRMPKIDGAKFYSQLQDLQESQKAEMPPVIFVSGFIEELKSRDLKWSRCEFLSKPFKEEDLLEKVQKVMSKPFPIKPDMKRILQPGEKLFQEGDAGNCMYYVIRGLLETSKLNSQGVFVPVNKIGTGELVGEMAILNGESQLLTVTAIEQTELISIPSEKVLAIVGSQPKWIKLMIENLSRRLKDSLKQIA